MTRHLLFLSAFCLFLISCQDKNENTESTKPNIIYILADDLGYGDLGCYGQQIIRTPNIDKLAADGMLFTDHYAGSSVCAPSRATLMLGQHTGHNRVRGNYETGPMGFGACLELRDEDVTIAEVLKQQGYTNGIIGKWGMGMDGTTGEPNKQGFDYSYGYLNQGHAHNQFPAYLFRNGKRFELPENQNRAMKSFSNDLFTKEALTFLEEKKENPFFLYMAYTTPHAEMHLPSSDIFDSYKGKVDEKAYKNMSEPDKIDGNKVAYRSQEFPAAAYAAQITHLDSCVGVLVQKLKDLGLEENTLIMFSSDNGPHSEGGANPRYFQSSGPLRGQKRDLYEGGVRVPFIAKWPSKIKPNSVSNHISAFWDMFPTFSEAAGATFDQKIDGKSLLPTLTGNTAAQEKQDYLYWEFHENRTTNQAVRKGNWKAVRMDPDGEVELYDLTKDIGETKNVAGNHPEVVMEMTDLLNNTRTEHEIWKMRGSKK
ncbi:Arylsulfatase A [Spirosomataceae bacterium TFI 002]|nr:Arylsulfatase A [Spirosomataceae bacterium TFI 002]